MDRQDAILQLSLDLIEINHSGHRKRTRELAIKAFNAMVLATVFSPEVSLTAQGKGLVLEIDRYLVARPAGQLSLEDILVLGFINNNRRAIYSAGQTGIKGQ